MPSRHQLSPRGGLIAVLCLAACRPADRELPRLKTLSDFRLTAVSARPGREELSLSGLRGAPWVANFIFTSCSGPCPLLSARMATLQGSLPAPVKLVSFTVDPDEDSPQVLRDYARGFEADPLRWRFVTGEKGALYRLLREGFGLPVVSDASQPAGTRVTHSTKFALVDSSSTVRGYYDGQDSAELSSLARDARTLLGR